VPRRKNLNGFTSLATGSCTGDGGLIRPVLDEYLRAADVVADAKSPLFRSAIGRTGTLAETAMHRVDAWRMIQRRRHEG
jgi:hypothetical protein